MIPTATELPPDLDVDKLPGEDDVIIIVIENNGPGDADSLIVREALRPGVIFVSSIPGIPLCVERSGTVTCGLGRLPSGDSTTVIIDVETEGVDPLSGTTSITADGVAAIQLDAPYMIKLGEPPFAEPGQVISYTLRVINPTGQSASNIRVADQMPQGVTIESASATSGNVTFSGQDITFTQATLAAGARVTITVSTVLAEETEAIEIVNEACLTSSLNEVPSCAEFGFFRASALPATGESRGLITPQRLLLALLGVGMAFGTLFVIRRRFVH